MVLKLLRPAQLEKRQIAAWSDLQAQPGLASPFLSPGWALALAGAGGPDAERLRVLVFGAEDAPRAFLPLRITAGVGGRVAGPAGAPLCDYQGVVAAAGFAPDLREALRSAGLARLDFDAAPSGQAGFSAFAQTTQPSFILDLSGGFEAYAEARRLGGAEILKDCAKKRRRLEREGGPLEVCEDPSPAALEQLLAWKRAQYGATGQTDIFAAGWPGRLLRILLAGDDPGCRARLFVLRQNGETLAAHLALCGPRVFHAWFIAHNEAFARASPGSLLLVEVARRAAAAGALELDLGAGDYRFKRSFASTIRPVAQGFIARPSAAGVGREAFWRVRHLAEALPLGRASALPAKAMRRLDLIRALA